MARALATGPRVLLLDEVVAGLNPVEAQRVVELIRKIRDGGTSIIMIEHVMHAVMGVSDRVMVLDDGRQIAEGTPQQVVRGESVVEGESLVVRPGHTRSELGISLVPEGRELWPSLTVLENLELGCYSKSVRKHRDESLERVFDVFPRLQERTKQAAGSMSGGEQQMVAIARALMSRPRLLMFDEPSLGLAPVVVTQVFAIIRRLAKEGLTILLVEQNLKKALEVADRGYVVETGSISMQGPARELLSNEGIRAAYLGI